MDYHLYLGLEIAEEFNNRCLDAESLEDIEIDEEPTQENDSEYDEF